jgi:glycosyltransferase involved in cell wall biosynthesis
MKEPFFSILLPTRNRSAILGGAIESVLAQTNRDFELVVSDNDPSPTATAEVVARYKDSRIRYVRTSGDLPMHENWENAFMHAQGRHVFVLEDKVRMVPNALEILHENLTRLGDVVISFTLTFARGTTLDGPNHQPEAQRLNSAEVIEMFCRFEQRFFTVLPKGLDSCAPRKLLQEVKQKSPTGLLFSYISPDYASGFMLLSHVKEFYRIEESLLYIPNNWMWRGQFSNGQASYKRTDGYKAFLNSLPVRREQILEHVPIKTEFLWINSVIYDFLTLYRRSDSKHLIHWDDYFAFCKVLLIIGRRLGADMLEQRAAIKDALRARRALFRARVNLNFSTRVVRLALQGAKGFFR